MVNDGTADPLFSPLGDLAGSTPAAPAWFKQAIMQVPERHLLPLRGGVVEVLSWGARGQPALLFMHGNAAHADIWRPFAPFLAANHRVIAFSWPGMGRSTWRKKYSFDEFADDILDIAQQLVLFDAPRPPIMIAHSMGGHPAVIAANRYAVFGGAIIIDSPIAALPDLAPVPPDQPDRPHRIYPTLETALARFRFAPVQPSPNLYLTDMVARASLEQVEAGWRWRFDPGVRKRMIRNGNSWAALAAPSCPLAFVTGARSNIADRIPFTMAQAPSGTPHVVIPEAYHHLMMDQPIAFISVIRSILAFWDA